MNLKGGLLFGPRPGQDKKRFNSIKPVQISMEGRIKKIELFNHSPCCSSPWARLTPLKLLRRTWDMFITLTLIIP